jgi:SAM-dependent methyltransferase
MLRTETQRLNGCSSETRCLIPTTNCYGWTSDVVNEVSEQFIAYATKCARPVLDIGAGLGVASLAALAGGASVISNDLCAEHLAILRAAVPSGSLGRLTPLVGRFPGQIQLPDCYLDAAHASNVLHFLPGHEVDAGIRALYRWLAPGGMVFAVASSPYIENLKNTIPVFESRKASGRKWPGEIEDIRLYSSHETLRWLPNFIHVFDSDVLSTAFSDAGFQVLTAVHFRRRGLPPSLFYDGRENVGVVARKQGGKVGNL